MKYAHQNIGCFSGVSEGSQNIKDGTHPEVLANWDYVFHGRVMIGSKHKADTKLLNALTHRSSTQVKFDPERFQNIGAA